MQARVSFNGGEYAPELDVRSDLDKYALGCLVLENWELGQTGGVKRRRGMRPVKLALDARSRLIPYVYSYAEGENLRFIVEIAPQAVRVLSMAGDEVAIFRDGDTNAESDGLISFNVEPDSVRYTQLNKLLILTSLNMRPMVLKYDGSIWEFEPWEFKHEPWRHMHDELQETEIIASYDGSNWAVDFGEADEGDTAETLTKADVLRVSHRTERVQVKGLAEEILAGVQFVERVPATATVGAKFAIREDEGVTRYVCISAFPADAYVEGLESPADYSNAFRLADTNKGFEDVQPIYSLKEAGAVSKGGKIAIKSESFRYYTCIRELSELKEGFTSFEDYPEYFISGLPIGDAVPSKGTWAFKCSGIWYGSYEVRRCYDTAELTGDWELRGESRSYNDAASNLGIEGTEKEEECFLRLFITRSRCLSSDFTEEEGVIKALAAGFPPDSSHNRLEVDSYVQDLRLKATPISNGNVEWECLDVFLPEAGSRIRTFDWSWAAFSERNGYPLLSAIVNQRLVFASTIEQPQTLWFSKLDDLNNFMEGDTPTAAILSVTLNTPTQDPICWMKQHKRVLLLGTTSAEFTISGDGGVISYSNITNEQHSDQGSDGQRAISMPGRVVFIGRGGRRAYEYGYNYEADGYLAYDLNLLSAHLGREHDGIRTGSALDSPDAVALFVLGDGQLALCVYNPLQEVRAWHRWTTQGRILDVCAMPNGKANDSVYLLVEREGTVWLEVVDAQSEYVDGEGLDYQSTMLTNTMHMATDKPAQPYGGTQFSACFSEPLELKEGTVAITTDGIDWYKVPSNAESLPAGWNYNLSSPSRNTFQRRIGIRVWGNRGAGILAIQG